ncbi:hypothetical protein [Kitasatospora griseola]|uniref:hypothetical protein n=1 Tax=Kitasatospora griseola TaxID=2064 RepID=UPI00382D1C68
MADSLSALVLAALLKAKQELAENDTLCGQLEQERESARQNLAEAEAHAAQLLAMIDTVDSFLSREQPATAPGSTRPPSPNGAPSAPGYTKRAPLGVEFCEPLTRRDEPNASLIVNGTLKDLLHSILAATDEPLTTTEMLDVIARLRSQGRTTRFADSRSARRQANKALQALLKQGSIVEPKPRRFTVSPS